MGALGRQEGLGEHLRDEHAESALEELRKIRKELSERYIGGIDIFDPGYAQGLGSLVKVEEKIERLTHACIWHAAALKEELKLKLLHTIDGYLSAVETKNPVSTFLLARYLLEQAATVSAVEFEVEDSIKINFQDWRGRGIRFFAALYKARHSTSDPKIKKLFSQQSIPEGLLKPIRIGNAIKALTARHGFASAVSLYDTLSNICHHNGSGHLYATEDMRMKDVIFGPSGERIFLKEKTAVARLSYPSSRYLSWSLFLTARPAWWSAYATMEMIDEIRGSPFSDKELKALTNGRLTNDRAAYREKRAPRPPKLSKVGRNEQCPCGSGKKYKVCCGRRLAVARTGI